MADIHHTLAPRTMVMPSGCIEWSAYRMKDGYGMLRVGRQMKLAHRVSYELSIGPIPDGMYILHHCDNPPCINPDHLFAGSQRDNMQDSLLKGRHYTSCGQDSPRSKLTSEQVLKIRDDERSYLAIAKEYGIAFSTVYRIRNRTAWKHLSIL